MLDAKQIDRRIEEVEAQANPHLHAAKRTLNLHLTDFSVQDKKRAE